MNSNQLFDLYLSIMRFREGISLEFLQEFVKKDKQGEYIEGKIGIAEDEEDQSTIIELQPVDSGNIYNIPAE